MDKERDLLMVEYEELPQRNSNIPARNPPPPINTTTYNISEVVIVYAEMHLLAGYINERLKSGWRLKGRIRKKIGNTYYQVMVK